MRYNEMRPGTYVVRTRELDWAKVLTGAICFIKQVEHNGIQLQITEDCVPVGKTYAVPNLGDDGMWHDVTELVLEANSAILPHTSSVAFTSPVAASYRNFLGLNNLEMYEGEAAEGNICMLGEKNAQGNLIFSKTGYYVVAYKDGYYIAYQGFCDYAGEGEQKKPTLRVLSLGGNRKFYHAYDIVKACEVAFNEDVSLSEEYTRRVETATVAAASDPAMRNTLGGVQNLDFG